MMSSQFQVWEHCIVEWIWTNGTIRINLPESSESHQEGSYAEVVQVLTDLGRAGWEVVSCAGVADWLLWTLKRPSTGPRSTGIAH